MFGGQGIYHDDVMFALETGGELYLKADLDSESVFRDLGSRPFGYTGRNGKVVVMSYWLMPSSAFDDEDQVASLAKLAVAAARRAKASKPSKGAAKKPASRRAAR